MDRKRLVFFVVAVLVGPGLARSANRPVPSTQPIRSTVQARPVQIGLASWYGKEFHGKETTSGERFNMYGFTAAHRTLPLGTWIRVTNLCNSRSLVLRVNDRGPVPQQRILDVSYGAARALGFKAAGIVPVRIEILPKGTDLAQNRMP